MIGRRAPRTLRMAAVGLIALALAGGSRAAGADEVTLPPLPPGAVVEPLPSEPEPVPPDPPEEAVPAEPTQLALFAMVPPALQLPAPPPYSPDLLPGDSIGPAYYLYAIYTGYVGPCYPDRIGTYQGQYYVPLYHYNTSLGKIYSYTTTGPLRRYTVGQYRYTEYQQRGFTTAFRYYGCKNSHPAHYYFGAWKVSRMKTLVQFCRDSCNAGTWTYAAWRSGW